MKLRSLVLFGLLWASAAAHAQSSSSLTAEKILDLLSVRQGGSVCEIGAGSGEMTLAAARLVGPTGRVYTNELGESRVSRLRENVASRGSNRITVVAGAATSTNFPDAACDGILLRDVYHHFTDPDAMNRSIAASLKPGGRVAVIDFAPPSGEASRPAGRSQDGSHGVRPETVSREMEKAGLQPVTSELPDARWFLLVLARPAS